MKVPFLDLKAQYASIREDVDAAVASVIADTAFIGGRYVKDFEQAFADKMGVKHCIGCANGTDALFLVMKMLGVGLGDEVITTSASWIATPEMVSLTGAKPVFVDVDPGTITLDPAKLEGALTSRTKGILPVHLYGGMTDMDPVLAFAEAHGLWVLEDCAQSHFSKSHGRLAGTMGVAGTFSFYPGKNLGAFGDAGAVVTNDDTLAETIRHYANHGQASKNDHRMEGYSSRLDGIQAAILSAKLPHLDAWNEARRAVGARYMEGLKGVGDLELPVVPDDVHHTFHVFAVRTADRDALRAHMAEHDVGSAIHYPTALPFIDCYREAQDDLSAFAVAKHHHEHTMSLPMCPMMSEDMADRVVDVVRAYFGG